MKILLMKISLKNVLDEIINRNKVLMKIALIFFDENIIYGNDIKNNFSMK